MSSGNTGREEADRLLREMGKVSFTAIQEALPILLSGKHEGWGCIGYGDDIHKTFSDPGDDRHPREIDFRVRIITIKLIERLGDYIAPDPYISKEMLTLGALQHPEHYKAKP